MTLASAASTDGPGHNDSSSSTGSGRPGVTPFVCFHCCTSTGELSSCSLQVFLNRGAARSGYCQTRQLQNLNYLRATVTPALRPLAGPGLPSQGPPGQVTQKVRGALRGPRRMSDTSRQVTLPSAVILLYNLFQRELR